MELIVRRIFLLGSILALASYANAAKCSRSINVITCVNADRGVIDRLAIYYKNDVALIVKDSSVGILGPGIFQGLNFVERLSLARCGITFVKDGVFQGVNLTHLNLAKNSIRNISEGVFLNLHNLKFLDLSHNAISRFESSTSYLPRLRYFDASNNRLEKITLLGNFSQLETIDLENNALREFPVDSILRFPKVKRVSFNGNSFNESYESFLTFALMSYNVKVDIGNSFFDDGWKSDKIFGNEDAVTGRESEPRSIRNEIKKDFKLSPETIKSMNHSELADLVDRILTVRNFTLTEIKMLELDRKRVLDESVNVKKEYTRIGQIIKRFNEVSREAKGESVGEYIEKSCRGTPDDSWWRRFKNWKCKKLFNWVKALISR